MTPADLIARLRAPMWKQEPTDLQALASEAADALTALAEREAGYRRALTKVMARLADLLDIDHFNNIEAIVLEAGVPFPPRTQHTQDCQKDWPRPGDPCTCGLDAALSAEDSHDD
jgi:hypothetical protein